MESDESINKSNKPLEMDTSKEESTTPKSKQPSKQENEEDQAEKNSSSYDQTKETKSLPDDNLEEPSADMDLIPSSSNQTTNGEQANLDKSEDSSLKLRGTRNCFERIHRYSPGATLQHGVRSQLQRMLRRYAFHSINISVFGFPNSGKSAFINTVNFAAGANQDLNYEEVCGERKVEASDVVSLTNKRQYVSITEEIGLIDNKGIDSCSDGILKEISRQCEGYRGKNDFIPDKWNHGFGAKTKDVLRYCCSGKITRLEDSVHCPVIVYSLQSEEEPAALAPVVDVFEKSCGTTPVVVMTNYDKLEDPDELLEERRRQFQNMHCARMFCLGNYTYRNHERKAETDKTVADIISACCLVADQYFLEKLIRSDSGVCC